jgi:hypothetical protein
MSQPLYVSQVSGHPPPSTTTIADRPANINQENIEWY